LELAHIEKQIYDLESTYLEDTQTFGNIFVGWNKYFLNDKSKKRKGAAVANHERLFSLSSASSPAALKEGRQVSVALSKTIESISQQQNNSASPHPSNKRSKKA
jgi:hypothetical protein